MITEPTKEMIELQHKKMETKNRTRTRVDIEQKERIFPTLINAGVSRRVAAHFHNLEELSGGGKFFGKRLTPAKTSLQEKSNTEELTYDNLPTH